MAHIELAQEFGDDMDRIADHLLHQEAGRVAGRLRGIFDAIQVLRDNPLIGRPTDDDMHGLVIGRGAHGHVVLYQYAALVDTVFVLAIRARREAGYARQ